MSTRNSTYRIALTVLFAVLVLGGALLAFPSNSAYASPLDPPRSTVVNADPANPCQGLDIQTSDLRALIACILYRLDNPKPAVTTTAPLSSTVPSTTTVAVATAAMNSDTMNALLNTKDPYVAIRNLDGRSEKEDHPVGGWTVTTGANESVVVWTGSYISDPTYGGNVSPLIVDGKTGVWLQKPGTTVTWQTPGGSIRVKDFVRSTNLTPSASGDSCVETKTVLAIINTNKKTNPNQIYVELDQLANTNVAARLRNEGIGTYTVQNSKALFWVKTGAIQGPALALDTTENKTLYLVTTDATVNLTYAHSGLRLCIPLNPGEQLPWWGKTP